MAREIEKLSALTIKHAKARGLLSDGGGLYLQISATGAKSWIYRYMRRGTPRTMGLGSLNTIGLADARTKAEECRRLLSEGIDPIQARLEQRAKVKQEATQAVTFKKCSEDYIAGKKIEWKNAKHTWQWSNSLEKYVYATIGDTAVQDIDTKLVLKVMEPIWQEITETATRIRERIETVLEWAKTRGYRTGDNPARWKGHLENFLANPAKIHKVEHYPALPYAEIGSFIAKLDENHPGNAAQALKFLILTVARTNEVVGAQWPEIDQGKGIWTIPANRMKMGKEHRVPLSQAALAILELMHRQHNFSSFVFPGQKKDGSMSNMALLMLLRRMGWQDITVHGFRSTFRDWAAEQTSYPYEVAEAALAHAARNKTEAAYFRSDLFEKRQKMMEDWAGYCLASRMKNLMVAGGAQRS